jgi:hypothetical protein
MRTGFATKKVIVSAGYAAITPQAPVNVVDGDGSAVIVGRAEAGVDDTVAGPAGRRGHARRGVAELIDLAITGVYPSTTKARKTGRWFLI